MSDGIIYLIHFKRPIGNLGNRLGQARHYIGWAKDLEKRLQVHRDGYGSCLMKAVAKAGVPWVVARTWKGDRHFERSLKNQKNTPRMCPICRGELEVEAGCYFHPAGFP